MILLVSMSLVSAADFTPNGDVNGRDVYNIKGFIDINGTHFNGEGSGITNITATADNESIREIINNSGYYNISVASSTTATTWYGYTSANLTQFETGLILMIKESWLSTLFDSFFSAKDTDDLTEGTTNLYDNQSWNQTHASTLYADISVVTDNASWNESHADTLYAPVNYGDDWNKTYGDTLYYALNNPYGYYNSTNTQTETDPHWTGNSTLVPYLASANTFTNNNIFNQNLTVDSGTFFVNSNTNNVGIGTTSPNAKFHVNGSAIINGTLIGLSNATISTGAVTLSQLQSVNNTMSGDFYLKSNPYGFWNSTFATFNKTYADTLYADISVITDNASWNESHADTIYIAQSEEGNLNVNHSDTSALAEDSTAWITLTSLSVKWFADVANVLTFDETELNATIDARSDFDTRWGVDDTWIYNNSGDLSFNTTSGDSRYYTQSAADSQFIEDSSEGDLNVNSSKYWDSLNSPTDITALGTISSATAITSSQFTGPLTGTASTATTWYGYTSANLTQFMTGSILQLKESWLSSLFDSHLSAKTTDDLTQGSTNFYDNQSWNEGVADAVYIAQSEEGNLDVNHSDTSTLAATATTWDGETSQANLNVNSSGYWDLLNSPTDITSLGTVASATSITSSAFVGPLTGNSATATALASNPTDCSVGEAPYTIDVNGNFGGCTSYSLASEPLSVHKDGTTSLTANWDVGPFTVTGKQFISDIISGTAPFVVSSTTVVNNLNANMVEGTDLGTLTNGRFCTYDSAGTEIDCDSTVTSGTVTSISTTAPINGGSITSTGTIGLDTATPSNGDTTHASTADQIYDWVMGLGYSTTVGTVTGVSGTSPIVSSGGATPAISATILKDLVTTSPLTGAVDNVFLGTDSDITLGITVAKDLVTTAPLTGGTDNILTGSDADITIAMPPATTSASGYLTTTDWNTFNGKSSTVGTVTSVNSGSGMDFSSITGTGSVTMGTPGILDDATTNAVTSSSHTHEIQTGISNHNIVSISAAGVVDDEFCRFTADGVEGRTNAEMQTQLGYVTSDTTYSAGNGISLATTTFSVAGGTALTQDASGLSVTNDAITDTQLAFNTGQHLTTTSAVTFKNVTVATTDKVCFNAGCTDFIVSNATGMWIVG